MAYSFKDSDDSVEAGLRRIACSQLDAALVNAASDNLSRDEKIHDIRKRCKKVRGLIRLVRPGFDEYSDENDALRDAAKRLSKMRDAAVHIDTFDRLVDEYRDYIEESCLTPIRQELVSRRAAFEDSDMDKAIRATVKALKKARARAEDWTLDPDGTECLRGGLIKTYQRAVDAMRQAYENRTGETLHEWRKRAKYHWYHVRLLKKAWPEGLLPRETELDQLTDDLGDHHDLDVFRSLLEETELGRDKLEELMSGLITSRQEALEDTAFITGSKLFAEQAENFADRVIAYWDLWRHEGGLFEKAAG